MVTDESFYMNLALKEAWKFQGLTYPNPAVGAVLLDKNGKILSIEAHKKAGLAHAEVEALKKGFLQLNPDIIQNNILENIENSSDIHDFLIQHHNLLFSECSLYVTLEPCSHYGKTPPCSSLISSLKLKKVFIGSLEPSREAGGGINILKSNGVEVDIGVLKDQCDLLLEPFVIWNRKKFIFFKHAQNINGTIDGGYISSDKTLDYVHNLRDKIDLIVVGGNTVRVDRPTLDARRVNGRPPDVFIYSKQKDFDRTIPLFDVKNRKVHIGNELALLKNYHFIMIEGGPNMFDSIKSKVDWHLTLISSKNKKGLVFNVHSEEKILYTDTIYSDILIWSKLINV